MMNVEKIFDMSAKNYDKTEEVRLNRILSKYWKTRKNISMPMIVC